MRAEIFICVLHIRVTVVIAARKIDDEFSTDFSTDSYITNNKCVTKTLLLDLWSLQVRQTISKIFLSFTIDGCLMRNLYNTSSDII